MSITHGHILTEWPGLADGKHFFAGYLPARLITLSRSGKSFLILPGNGYVTL